MSSISDKWMRVTRSRPCLICERPDWCLIAKDEGAVICARVESSKRCGDAGWLHRLRDEQFRPARRRVRVLSLAQATPDNDLSALATSYRNAVNPAQLNALARSLGLTATSLLALGIGWSLQQRAWSFPMTDCDGNVMGIRLRRTNGSKFSVMGGREGLFIPLGVISGHRLFICEGPTDLTAMLQMGFTNAVGRPSCNGGIKLLVDLVTKRKPTEVVIASDGDDPGQRGAENLASVLVAYAPIVRVIRPPREIKDMREWLRYGGNRNDVELAINSAPVRRLTIRAVAPTKGQ